MRCNPSSRSFAEKRGVWLFASPSGDIGPATLSLSRTDSAKMQRSPICASAFACGPIPLEFSTIVVVPVRIASSAPIVIISVASSPRSRLAGRTASRAELGKPKSSLKPRSSVAARCAWQLISPGKSALPRPSITSAFGRARTRSSVGPIAAIRSPSIASATSSWTRSTVTTVVCAKTIGLPAAVCASAGPRSSRSAAAPAPAPARTWRRVTVMAASPRAIVPRRTARAARTRRLRPRTRRRRSSRFGRARCARRSPARRARWRRQPAAAE